MPLVSARVRRGADNEPTLALLVLDLTSTERALPSLSRVQREVARLVLAGCSDREIAHVRGIALRTAQNHVAALFRKTGTHSRGELVAALVHLD